MKANARFTTFRCFSSTNGGCDKFTGGGCTHDRAKQRIGSSVVQEVWNEGRETTIDELFAEGCVAYGLGDTETEVREPAQFKIFVRNLRDSFPDIHISIDDIMAEEEKVMVRVLLEGTHLGSGLGVPPTGRRICVAGIILIRLSKGQFIEAWNSWDQLGLLRQIGTLPVAKGEDQFLSKHSSRGAA